MYFIFPLCRIMLLMMKIWLIMKYTWLSVFRLLFGLDSSGESGADSLTMQGLGLTENGLIPPTQA